jgi:hypothetical protein
MSTETQSNDTKNQLPDPNDTEKKVPKGPGGIKPKPKDKRSS